MNALVKYLIVVILLQFYFDLHAQVKIEIKIDEKNFRLGDPRRFYSGFKSCEFIIKDSLISPAPYWYRVRGYETDWHFTQYPYFRYSGLPGGDYTFQLSQDSSHRKMLAEYPFQVRRVLWETWWAKFFIVGSILGICALVIYFWLLYDFRQKMKVEVMRQKIAADLHDEVGSNLSSMAFSAELLKKKLNGQTQELHPLINTILSHSLETSSLIGDTIWALNPQNDPFDKLIDRIQNFTHDILSAREIKYNFDLQTKGQNPQISIEQKRNIYLIFKEAINNIAKHAGATLVNIRVQCTVDRLTIDIEDNGKGFDPDVVYAGNGLGNFKSRSVKDNLEVTLSSTSGKGTKINIMVPFLPLTINH